MDPAWFEGPVDVSPASWKGGPDGVLAVHGFSGSPHSMRPWARFLAERGYAVEMPRLPGHGTSPEDFRTTGWREWAAEVDQAYFRLRSRCERVAVAGLSMGGTLALHLAARREVAALSLVNPAAAASPLLCLSGAVSHVVPTLKGLGDDIAMPGRTEGAYHQLPVAAASQLNLLLRQTRRSIRAVRCPVQIFRSRTDHIVPDSSLAFLERHLPQVPEVRWLERSYHVATVDYDAPVIFEESQAFLSGAGLRTDSERTP